MILAVACAPFRSTLRESESGAPFRAVCFVARLANMQRLFDAARFAHPILESRRRGPVEFFNTLLAAPLFLPDFFKQTDCCGGGGVQRFHCSRHRYPDALVGGFQQLR